MPRFMRFFRNSVSSGTIASLIDHPVEPKIITCPECGVELYGEAAYNTHVDAYHK